MFKKGLKKFASNDTSNNISKGGIGNLRSKSMNIGNPIRKGHSNKKGDGLGHPIPFSATIEEDISPTRTMVCHQEHPNQFKRRLYTGESGYPPIRKITGNLFI